MLPGPLAEISPKTQFICAALGTGCNIQSAVLVKIGQNYGDRVRPASFEGMLLPAGEREFTSRFSFYSLAC